MSYKKYLKSLNKKDALVLYNESLKKHTTFGIGGQAKYFVIVNNTKTLIDLTNRAKSFFIIGAGSNVLFNDIKYNSTFIKLGKSFLATRVSKNKITVGAGVNLFKLNAVLKANCLGGLEFTFGIPGSVGGAIVSNAGAFGGEIGNYVEKVKVFDGNRVFWTKKFLFSYRNSSFKESNLIILAASFKLNYSSFSEIEKLQKEYIIKRKETQPYGEKSAGSVFKRIIKEDEIIFPAKIIDNFGLKGVKINSAQISKKHAGFIVNSNNAKFRDVLKLIKLVKKQVRIKTKQTLEEEIIIVKGKRNGNFRRFSHPQPLQSRNRNCFRKRPCGKSKGN